MEADYASLIAMRAIILQARPLPSEEAADPVFERPDQGRIHDA